MIVPFDVPSLYNSFNNFTLTSMFAKISLVNFNHCRCVWASQIALVVKSPPANAGDRKEEGSMPGSWRSAEGGHGNPLQYSCQENSMDRETWQATIHRAIKSWTWLKQLSTQSVYSVIVILTCIFLMVNVVEHFFLGFLAFCVFSLVNFKSFVHLEVEGYSFSYYWMVRVWVLYMFYKKIIC